MSLIIDCHGHYTTAPKALETWRNQQIAGIQDASSMPKVAGLKISDINTQIQAVLALATVRARLVASNLWFLQDAPTAPTAPTNVG